MDIEGKSEREEDRKEIVGERNGDTERKRWWREKDHLPLLGDSGQTDAECVRSSATAAAGRKQSSGEKALQG
ncbi:hypothetical protein EYF80_030628 [Liparis tanakae]|uniref:Uncharacterized protein n=1 Tax=Liparis tanakae TaxID=230148 RepID=A0A4Z2GZZ9_9TELE|nr:hypothetical protein EYF80_030628 [Liparis tanakae]